MALLHADSRRRHCRGAYSDAFLDGDVEADRRPVRSSRLSAPSSSATVVAEEDTGLAGFVHVVFDEDGRWGSLVDHLHVTRHRRRTGLGTALFSRAAAAVAEHARGNAMYLWVLEQIVHDLLHTWTNGSWQQRASSYPKLRIASSWLVEQCRAAGLDVCHDAADSKGCGSSTL
ncbi:GNAT family N-acetyltransferase [Streptomyces bobili]|uniref:GNAT family N-acetyltransferase n=1 Tax=Streptomyces bobili TaxID=67280 RepID=UPI00366463FC